MTGEAGDFVPITVNVEALSEESYNKGYKDGMEEGRSIGFNEGYREAKGDMVARLRMMSEAGMDIEACILEFERSQ